MYRSDLGAAQARADALERENERLRHAIARDRWRSPGPIAHPPSPYDLPPSSGGSVLAWGLVSMLLCHFLGPVAWAMGNRELQRIDGGLVSPHGRSSAVAGRVLGIISTVLLVTVAVVVVIVIASASPHHR